MVVIPPHNLGPNSGKWGTIITRLLQQLEDRSNHAVQTAERAVKSNASVMDAVQQTNTQIAETQNDLANNRRIAAAPENISTTTVGAWDALGNPVSSIEISWDAVTVDTHGDNLNISSYEVWWKTGAAVYLPGLNGDPTDLIDSSYYKRLTSTPGLSLTTTVDANTLYSFAVRAVTANGINGVFSLASDITSDASVGTIVAPTKPTVSQTVGVVSVMWDGNLTSGGLPNYFRYVKVLQSTSSTGTYVDTGQTLSGAGGIAISGLIDGQAYYYKLQAVDSTGNASGLSVASDSITPEGVDLSGLEADISSAQLNAAAALSAANTAQTTADSAQSDADAASAAAASAAGIANSKAVVLYQTTAPGSTYQNSLTLWIDTTSGANTPKRWNGSAWVAVTDKVATDAAQAAATANTAAGTAQTAANTAQTTANTAITNAATADSKAVAAQTTANGKNTVYYASSAPTGGTYKVNDIWFDTANGNRINKWSGSAWTTAQLGSGAIANGAVTATQIAAAVNTAITNAQTTATNAATAASTADGKAVTAQNTANAAQTAASDAQSDADAASAAAASAAGIANSKGKVLIQSTAPAAADQLAQNLWIDTTGGANTPKRWSGSAWAAVTDKAATDAAAAAVAAQSTADTAKANAATAQAKADSAYTNAATAQTTATNAANAAAAASSDAADAQTTANTAVSNAATAQSAADAANAAAADAAGIANGKGKVIFSNTAPTGTDAAATTLWIDTTGGANTPKRWVSGTTWSVVTDKAATDAASAAAAANTAAGNAQTTANTAVTNAATAQSAANAAQAKADSAFINAGNAQTTANGKNVVTYSTVAASSGTPGSRAGDVWFQQSGGVVLGQWVWSGTAWVQQTLSNAVLSSIDAGKITSGSISAARIAANTITSAMIAANTIVAADIAAHVITANEMVVGTITAASGIIADAAITTAKIANLAVTDAQIANGTITNASIANIDAGKITTGSIAAARIAAGTITSTMIAANTIIAGDIAAGTITATEIAANTITAAKIAAGTITANEIASGAITTAKLDATAINGMTITGATLQTTATASRGIKIDTTGLSAYNSSGTRTVFIDPTTGALNATSGSFTGIVNATGGTISGALTVTGSLTGGTITTSPDPISTYVATLKEGRLALSTGFDNDTSSYSNGALGFDATDSGNQKNINGYGTGRFVIANRRGTNDTGAYADIVLDSSGAGSYGKVSSNAIFYNNSLTPTHSALLSIGTDFPYEIGLAPDTGWVAATFPSGMHSFDEGPNKVYWRLINNIAYWKGLVAPTSGSFSTAQQAMIILPPAVRPSGSLQFPGVTAGTQGSGQVVSVYVNGGAGDYIYHLLTPTSPGTYISMTGIAYPVP